MKQLRITHSITQRDELTNALFSQISKYQLLTPEEERTLAERLSYEGKIREEARNELVTHNIRFAVSVAKQYQNYGLPLIDLISEACIGLCKACDSFEVNRNVKFTTYAVTFMREQILSSLEKNGRTITVPHNVCNYLSKYRRLSETLYNKEGRTPSIEEFAEYAGISIDIADLVMKNVSTTSSLDDSIGEYGDEHFTVADTVVGGCIDDRPLDCESAHKALVTALNETLSERDALAVMACFGLVNQTLSEVALMYNTSYETLHRAVMRGIERIQKNKKVMNTLSEYRIAA